MAVSKMPKNIKMSELRSAILQQMNLTQVNEMWDHMVHEECTDYIRCDLLSGFSTRYTFSRHYELAWPNKQNIKDIIDWLFEKKSGDYYSICDVNDWEEDKDMIEILEHIDINWTNYSFIKRAKKFSRYFQIIDKPQLARLFSAYISQQEQPLTKKHNFKRKVDADEVKVSKPKKQTLAEIAV